MAAGLAEEPHRECRTICLPISEDEYRQIVGDRQLFRQWLSKAAAERPELFPEIISDGFQLKDRRLSAKRNLWLLCSGTIQSGGHNSP